MGRAGRIRHSIGPTRWPTAAEAASSPLFQPIDVGPVRLSRRTWVPAMVPWRATEDGECTEALVQWYGRFAEGRPGAIVVEATGIRDIPSGPLLRIGHERYISGLGELVRQVRDRSGGETRLFIQLIDFLTVKRRPPPQRFFERFLNLGPHHRQRLSELDADDRWRAAPRDDVTRRLLRLTDEEVDQVLDPREIEDLRKGYRERVTDTHLPAIASLPQVLPSLFADAARRAEAAGFDGVELHFAHAYTMASFLSPLNDRADGYGGSREARARLPLEVYRACRDALSETTALGCRFLVDEVIEGGGRLDDAVDHGVRFAEAGMDFLSLSRGGKFEDARPPRVGEAIYPYTGPSGHECMPTIYSDERGPFGRYLPMVRAVRAAVRGAGFATPIVGAGGINTFELADGALARGDCDIIAAARQSLADPDWFAKMEQGCGDEIRRCKMTNYCEGLDQRHKQVTCQLWDRQLDGAQLRSSDGKRRLVAPPWKPDGA